MIKGKTTSEKERLKSSVSLFFLQFTKPIDRFFLRHNGFLSSGVMIHNSWQGIEFSWLNSLLSWVFSRQDKNIKILELSMDLLHWSNMKVILTLQVLNHGDWVPCSCIGYFLIVNNPTHLAKSYSPISEKHDLD